MFPLDSTTVELAAQCCTLRMSKAVVCSSAGKDLLRIHLLPGSSTTSSYLFQLLQWASTPGVPSRQRCDGDVR